MLKSNNPGVIAKFNVKPNPKKKEYYMVVVFKTKKDMLEYWNSRGGELQLFFHFEALTHGFEAAKFVKGKKKTMPIVGQVLFYKGNLGPAIVAHEMAHAAVYYARKHKWQFQFTGRGKKWNKTHEDYAYMVGYLVSQFWKKYNKKISVKNESY